MKRKAATGDLPVPLEEKIEVLVLLARDEDDEIRGQALQTLQTWNSEELPQVLSSPATPRFVLDFAVDSLVNGREELIESLIRNPAFGEAHRQTAPDPSPPSAEVAPEAGVTDSAAKENQQGAQHETAALQRISRMSAAEKIRTALMGSHGERLILIRDGNKSVAHAVLQSPKITDVDAEAYASLKTVTDEVLRQISINRNFMRHYAVVKALVNNPRAPVDITLPLVGRLNDRDLKALTVNKNILDALRALPTKLCRNREGNRKQATPGHH